MKNYLDAAKWYAKILDIDFQNVVLKFVDLKRDYLIEFLKLRSVLIKKNVIKSNLGYHSICRSLLLDC